MLLAFCAFSGADPGSGRCAAGVQRDEEPLAACAAEGAQSTQARKPRVAFPAIKQTAFDPEINSYETYKPLLTPCDIVIKKAPEHRKYGFPNLC